MSSQTTPQQKGILNMMIQISTIHDAPRHHSLLPVITNFTSMCHAYWRPTFTKTTNSWRICIHNLTLLARNTHNHALHLTIVTNHRKKCIIKICHMHSNTMNTLISRQTDKRLCSCNFGTKCYNSFRYFLFITCCVGVAPE